MKYLTVEAIPIYFNEFLDFNCLMEDNIDSTIVFAKTVAEKIYYEDDYRVLIAASDDYTKAIYIDEIKKAFLENYDESVLQIENNKISCGGSFILLLNFLKKENAMISDRFNKPIFDLSILDKENTSSDIADYWICEYLPSISEKTVIITSNFKESSFHLLPEEVRIIVYDTQK